MSDNRTIATAIRLADGCLKDAKVLLESGSRNAAYLCEQALEHLVRAHATAEAIHISRSDAHQVDKVLRGFPSENAHLERLRSLSWLEAYATSYRYPTPAGRLPATPDSTRLAEAIKALMLLIDEAARHFQVPAGDRESPAGNMRPLRN